MQHIMCHWCERTAKLGVLTKLKSHSSWMKPLTDDRRKESGENGQQEAPENAKKLKHKNSCQEIWTWSPVLVAGTCTDPYTMWCPHGKTVSWPHFITEIHTSLTWIKNHTSAECHVSNETCIVFLVNTQPMLCQLTWFTIFTHNTDRTMSIIILMQNACTINSTRQSCWFSTLLQQQREIEKLIVGYPMPWTTTELSYSEIYITTLPINHQRLARPHSIFTCIELFFEMAPSQSWAVTNNTEREYIEIYV